MRKITLNCFWVTAKAVKGMREGLESTDGKCPNLGRKTKQNKNTTPRIKNDRQ